VSELKRVLATSFWPAVFTTLVGFALLVTHSCPAAPPPNDLCTGVELIPTNGPFPYFSAIVDVKDATTNSDPAAPSCVFNSVNRGVWYRFTPPATALYTIACSGDTATTVLDTVMAIYTSSGGCAGPFTEVDCNDDAGDLQSAISRTLNAGVSYYILVWVSSTSPPLGNNSTVQLRVSRPTVPANDTCAGAEIIPTVGPFPHLSSVADTTLATTTGDPPAAACWGQARRSVWFKFTPDTTTTYELTLCTNTATTIYETLLAVYTASSSCASFTQIACNHTTPCGNKLRSTITTPLTNGITYYIVGWEGVNDVYIPGETSLQLRVNRHLAPIATTLGSTNLSLTSASISGSVNPNNLPTTAWFEWGTTLGYGSNTTPQTLAAANSALPFSATLSGLTPGTTYHYRARATNSLGLSLGADQSFLASLTPSASTLSAYGLTSTSAVLQASVTPNATTTFAWFQYGLTTNYGSATAPGNVGAATSPLNLQSAISTLTPGALHHFRVVATNSIGVSFGADLTFTWSSNPPTLTAFYPTNGSYSLRFLGQSNQLYGVMTSTNLLHWTNGGFSSYLGDGLFERIVPDSDPARFFQVFSP